MFCAGTNTPSQKYNHHTHIGVMHSSSLMYCLPQWAYMWVDTCVLKVSWMAGKGGKFALFCLPKPGVPGKMVYSTYYFWILNQICFQGLEDIRIHLSGRTVLALTYNTKSIPSAALWWRREKEIPTKLRSSSCADEKAGLSFPWHYTQMYFSSSTDLKKFFPPICFRPLSLRSSASCLFSVASSACCSAIPFSLFVYHNPKPHDYIAHFSS